ncbi:MAG: hypothetical protein KDA93_16255 [Planctomycetaceae bacterium]|nr:hypothetical protein [Planctomycetaceae bacterium]
MNAASIIIKAPTGRSRLPIVELNESAVRQDRKQIRVRRGSAKRAQLDSSFGNFSRTLDIRAWRFYHAAKKTEFTTSFSRNRANELGLVFAHEYREFFTWTHENLRRTDRTVFGVEDFFSSALAGRFGEAAAYLTMVSLGYVYWDRIAVLAERAMKSAVITHSDCLRRGRAVRARLGVNQPDLEPDFAFENMQQQVALVEAKGSVVDPERDDPSTKDDLRHALRQIDAWATMILPTPHKYYAIGTYFREESDSSDDPSLIAVVDPPAASDPEVEPIEFPPDWIRRGNYGAWLRTMGLNESGNALVTVRKGTGAGFVLPVMTIGKYEFAVLPRGLVEHSGQSMRQGSYVEMLMDFLSWGVRPFFDRLGHPISPASSSCSILLFGLEVGVFQHVARALASPSEPVLLQVESIADDQSAEWFSGSTLPDGSMVGTIRPGHSPPPTRMQEFVL